MIWATLSPGSRRPRLKARTAIRNSLHAYENDRFNSAHRKARRCGVDQFDCPGIQEVFDLDLAGKDRVYPIAELGAMTDLLVVAGGDGSILRVIGQLGEMIKPIFGINVGSLGFLTCASSSNYREAVECIAKDRINFSHRALLEARVTLGDKRTNKMLALNDAVLSRGELSRLVMLRTRVTGETLTE